MKITKIFSSIFSTKNTKKTKDLVPPIAYNPRNVTRDEFKSYIKYLAENNINRTIYEPEKFITTTKRLEQQAYKNFVKKLADSKSNLTFYQ